jgi:hypothetical protein
MIAFCKERGIVVTAYAPFGRPGGKVVYMRHDVPPLLQDSKLQEIATKHGKTVAQVILRYLVSTSNKSLYSMGFMVKKKQCGQTFLEFSDFISILICHSQPNVLLRSPEDLSSSATLETG